jgi:hypothetical protein
MPDACHIGSTLSDTCRRPPTRRVSPCLEGSVFGGPDLARQLATCGTNMARANGLPSSPSSTNLSEAGRDSCNLTKAVHPLPNSWRANRWVYTNILSYIRHILRRMRGRWGCEALLRQDVRFLQPSFANSLGWKEIGIGGPGKSDRKRQKATSTQSTGGRAATRF